MKAKQDREQIQTVSFDLTGERRLWLAVLMQAIEDWRNGSLRARRKAQSFLFASTGDFEAVCANAGLDPGHLRGKLQKVGRMVHEQGPWVRPVAA